jgi:hypothetical protein
MLLGTKQKMLEICGDMVGKIGREAGLLVSYGLETWLEMHPLSPHFHLGIS